MKQEYKDLIANEFRSTCERTIERVAKKEDHKPFHEALLTSDILTYSAFERSFSTSFGQRAIEEISRYVVLANGATAAKRQKETIVSLPAKAISEIDAYLRYLRSGNATNSEKDFENALRKIMLRDGGSYEDVRIISDLWWNKDGINNYASIKTVKPNIDQTAVAKQDMLMLKAFDNACNVYFGLYYNPFGEDRESYTHNPPQAIFNMRTEPTVLIGRDYWDTLGGPGTYEELLEIAADVGEETRKKLQSL